MVAQLPEKNTWKRHSKFSQKYGTMLSAMELRIQVRVVLLIGKKPVANFSEGSTLE